MLEEALLLAMTVACLELGKGRKRGKERRAGLLFQASVPEEPCSEGERPQQRNRTHHLYAFYIIDDYTFVFLCGFFKSF